MNARAFPLTVLSLLALSACAFLPAGDGTSSASSSSSSSSSASGAMVIISEPLANAQITSPLTVSGEARGTWYFEASFPVKLFDGNGQQIAIGIAQAQSDWMTVDFVPFTTQLIFSPPATATGTLVLEKDNPSGLPEHAASVSIPVQF